MKNPFAKKATTPDETSAPEAAPAAAYDPKNPPLSADGWDPKKMRDVVFQTLGSRVGLDLAVGLREDFDAHLAEDPINGVEAGWICLVGKLVETIDKFNDALNGAPIPLGAGPQGGGGDVSPFTTFRKDG